MENVFSVQDAMVRMCTGVHNSSTAGNSSSYYYFNGPLYGGPFEAIAGELGGEDPLMNVSLFSPTSSSILTHQVWMGTPGVSTDL
jgi:hypothetical protein